MDQQTIIEITQTALKLVIDLSAPVMLVGLAVGVLIALIQALTQIQEMTLTFVPKMIAIFAMMFVFFPVFGSTLIEFMEFLSDQMIAGDLPDFSEGS